MIFFFLLSFFLTHAFSCEVTSPERFSLHLDPILGEMFPYSGNANFKITPTFKIKNCEQTALAKKYLMLATGVQNLEFSNRIEMYDFNNDYRDSGCFISSTFFKRNQTFEERKKNLNKKWNTINSCLNFELLETKEDILEVPPDQPGCKPQRLGPKKISFNGGFCFIKPKRNSEILVSISLNKLCQNQVDLQSLNIASFDLQTLLNFYIAGDPSGTSIDLTSIDSFPVRFSITPDKSLLNISDDFGLFSPQFPASFELSDLYLGIPEIQLAKSGRWRVRPTFWTDHECMRNCRDNFCQSACDYARALSGNFELISHKNSKKEIIAAWFDGSVLPPFFQGEIITSGFEIEKENLLTDTLYELKLVMIDPKFDFDEFKSSFISKIPPHPTLSSRITSTGIPEIPLTGSVPETTAVPLITRLPQLNFSYSPSQAFQQVLRTFSSYLNHTSWPPYFDKICYENKCRKILDTPYLEMSLYFKLLSLSEEDKTFPIKVTRFMRKSDLMPPIDLTLPEMPRIKCPF